MKKIGILTFHKAINYGAILQAYALQKTIETMGKDVDIIDYDNNFFKKIYFDQLFLKGNAGIKKKIKYLIRYFTKHSEILDARNKYNKLIRFANENLKLSESCTRDNVAEVCEDYEAIVVGSDQVWNLRLSNYDTTYMLDFIESCNKKKSYAASFGTVNLEDRNIELAKKNLPQFTNTLIREKSGKKMLEEMGIESNVVLDPTFLINKEHWIEISKNSSLVKEEDYIFVYCVAEPEKIIEVVDRLAAEENLKVIVLGNEKFTKNQTNIADASIEDFLWFIDNAKYVFTTSFHGLALSLNLNTNFYYELASYSVNNNSRLTDLSDVLGLADREITNFSKETISVDWEAVNAKIESLREESYNLLKESLK